MKRVLPLLCAALAAGVALAATKPMAFTPATLDLSPGDTYPVELFVPNPTGKATTADLRFEAPEGLAVRADSRWTGQISAYGAKTWPQIVAAKTAKGDVAVTATAEGLGSAKLDVSLREPRLELLPEATRLTIRVTNTYRERKLKGRLIVSNPDRFLQDVTTREFFIEPGETQALTFPLPGAAPVQGESYDFTVQVQSYAGYASTRTYPLQFPPQRRAASPPARA